MLTWIYIALGVVYILLGVLTGTTIVPKASESQKWAWDRLIMTVLWLSGGIGLLADAAA